MAAFDSIARKNIGFLTDQLNAAISNSPYRSTLAAAVADLAVGAYFSSRDADAVGPHAGIRWNYKRIAGAPGWQALEVWAAPQDVGLGNVNNTADADKPISTAVASALGEKADVTELTKANVGLGSVDNVSDLDKPVSTAQQAALDSKADKLSTALVRAIDAPGDSAPEGAGITIGNDDSDELEALINTMRVQARITMPTGGSAADDSNTRSISAPALYLEAGRFYRITRDMPLMPPGSVVRGSGAHIVIGANNIRVFHTTRGATSDPYLKPGGNAGTPGDFQTVYGTNNLDWELPTIHCNGFAGTFIVLDTISRSRFGAMNFIGGTGSSYTLTGAVTNGSRFVSVAPAAYATVKKGDVLNLGDTDQWGNPEPYLVVDKKVINSGATGTTYGKLKIDRAFVGATNAGLSFTQCSFPLVTMKLQQFSWPAGPTFQWCDWGVYHGRNADETTSGGQWTDETVTAAYGFNDTVGYGRHVEDFCKYGSVLGPWGVDIFIGAMSVQFNRSGSGLLVKCLSARVGHIRIENKNVPAIAAVPTIVVGQNSSFVIDGVRFNHNNVGRYLLGVHDSGCIVAVCGWSAPAGDMPTMPDGSLAPFVKRTTDGVLHIRDLTGPNGQFVNHIEFIDSPRRWVTTGSNAYPGYGYSGVQGTRTVQQVYMAGNAGVRYMGRVGTNDPMVVGRNPGDELDRVEIRNFSIRFGAGVIPPVQVLGRRQTGWSTWTGTANKTAKATYTAGMGLNFGASYSQSEHTALAARLASVETSLEDVSCAMKALLDALHQTSGHGLIGLDETA